MHPLDPLTAEEISKTSNIIRSQYPGQKWEFITISLAEPSKDLMIKYLSCSGETKLKVPRCAFVVLFERDKNQTFHTIVDLDNENEIQVLLCKAKPGLQPMFNSVDFAAETEIVKKDPGVIRRCEELGYPDMNLVIADAWPLTFSDGKEFPDVAKSVGGRFLQYYLYGKQDENDNAYAHPFDFCPVVDLLAGKVISIRDLPIDDNSDTDKLKKPAAVIPSKTINFDPEVLGQDFYRNDVKPIDIISPQGPNFTVNGHQISWGKFNFRVGFTSREGLVLHTVSYNDDGKIRQILYRASIAEMLVPYGDSRPPFHEKAAFDAGANGLGFCANSLQYGSDCIGHVHFFDEIVNDVNGDPKLIKNAICVYEEDTGLLFKHKEYRTGKATVTRGQRLVLSFIATILNYDYAFCWYFNSDASIGFEVKSTGLISTILHNGSPEELSQGTLVSENVLAQNHQHIFVARLDMMIDGVKNSVSVLDTLPIESQGQENPYGQGFRLHETHLRDTTQAKSDISWSTSRVWRIFNESCFNPITKEPVGWNLIPKNQSAAATVLAKPGSIIRERGHFATHAVWVTPYNADENFPAGFYVNQSWVEGGMAEWTKVAKNIHNEDIVVWHVFGLNHVPRIEDFPIMTVEPCGFILKPNNFFNANPALDILCQKSEEKLQKI